MKDKIILPASIIIAGVLIGTGFYIGNKKNDTPYNTINKINKSLNERMAPISDKDHILGNPNARIVIVEYSDTECPFCKIFHNTMLKLMNEYGSSGDLAWVYRHFPIEELHKKAFKQSEALECANELGGPSKFWEYTNRLYEITPSNDGLDESELPLIAEKVGLIKEDFLDCLSSGKYVQRVKFDLENALSMEADGTPFSILIDTKTNERYPIVGAYPYFQLKQTIDLIIGS